MTKNVEALWVGTMQLARAFRSIGRVDAGVDEFTEAPQMEVVASGHCEAIRTSMLISAFDARDLTLSQD